MQHPIVLVDGGDDGMDSEGWVEKTVPEPEVLPLLAPLNMDPDLYTLELAGTTHLRPDDLARPRDDDQPWRPCDADDEGAIEFWVARTVDR